jgi:hypothetical protein
VGAPALLTGARRAPRGRPRGGPSHLTGARRPSVARPSRARLTPPSKVARPRAALASPRHQRWRGQAALTSPRRCARAAVGRVGKLRPECPRRRRRGGRGSWPGCEPASGRRS